MDNLIASEALYSFCGWLTSQDEEIRIGSEHDCTDLIECVRMFCDKQQFAHPRKGWSKNIVPMQSIKKEKKMARPMVGVTKRFSFCYGHQLTNHPGKCKNNHGHNAELEVTVRRLGADLDKETGMVVDFNTLKEIFSALIEQLDHQWLNDIIHPTQPTAERTALWLYEKGNLALEDHGLTIVRLRLSETPDSWVTLVF